MELTIQSAPYSEQNSMDADPPQHTVALRDLEIARWRPAESYDTSTITDTTREDLHATSLEDSGMVSPTADSSDHDFGSTSSSEDEDGSPELDTPLEYAHFYGLCRDYQMDHPLSSELIPLPPDDFLHVMNEPEDASSLDALLAEVHGSLNERLDVDKEVANFLMSVLRTCKQNEGEHIKVDLASLLPKPLKLELPVLSCDHEVEIMTLRRRNEVTLIGKGIEPFELDEEKGDDLTFSAADLDGKRRLDSKLQNEKLNVDKETVELFRQLRDVMGDKETDYADEAYSSYKVGKAVHISPPLLPMTPPHSPSGPAPEAMQIDMTSTPEDLIAKDLAAVEKELLDRDDASGTTSAAKAPFDTQETAAAIDSYTAAPSSSSPLARKRLRNIRVEPPLTPQYHTDSTSEEEPTAKKVKKVQFDPQLVSLLPDLQPDSSDAIPELAKQQLDDLQNTIARGAESVQQQLQNEQLVEIDTTMRVKVPHLEAVQIQPPWDSNASSRSDTTQLQSHQLMLNKLSKELLNDIRKWGDVAKIERSLQWAPFPSYLAKVDMAEQFDDGSLDRYLAEMSLDDETGDVDVHALVAKKEGSGLLPSHDSDDDEVEQVIMEEDNLDDPVLEEDQPTRELPIGIPPSVKLDLLEVLRAKQRDITGSAGSQPIGSKFGATTISDLTQHANINLMQTDGIAQFMQLRGKSMGVQHAVADTSDKLTTSAAQQAVQNQAPAAVMVPKAVNPSGQLMSPPVIPIPDLGEQHLTVPVIVSSATMASRQLIRRIQTALPGVDFCERDAMIATRPQHSSSLHGEADFTISPSTGVISTTLQKLKQKPLPGQLSTSGIRDIIASTAMRYERLIVLVSEGTNMTTEEGALVRTLDQLDCEALTDLTSWTNSLDSEVQVTYVPGGEQELAGWLAAAFSHLGNAKGNVQLLQDETMWERWLRVAGMNAYAAQAVLSQLKAPDSDLPDAAVTAAQKRFGLAAFVSMKPEERLERFTSVLGGEKVLRRVSEVIDGGWSAKGGRM